MSEEAAHTPRYEVVDQFKFGRKLYRPKLDLTAELKRNKSLEREVPKLLELDLIKDAAKESFEADKEKDALLQQLGELKARLDALEATKAPEPETKTVGDPWDAESEDPTPEPPKRRGRRRKTAPAE